MAKKEKEPTPFEQAVEQFKQGKLQTPKVFVGVEVGEIEYFRYQLAVHKYNLGIMAAGMTCRGIKLKDIKAYYGLVGKTAKDCLPAYKELMDNFLKSPYTMITDPQQILDCLGGAISGDYKKDVAEVRKVYRKEFSCPDYDLAYQMDQQP